MKMSIEMGISLLLLAMLIYALFLFTQMGLAFLVYSLLLVQQRHISFTFAAPLIMTNFMIHLVHVIATPLSDST